MGYQDRHYYRDSQPGRLGPLQWLMSGSLPLFTLSGIRVRMHASMALFIGLILLLGAGDGYTMDHRITSMTVLFAVVLVHEFGHCLMARWVGGSADDILLWPLGGLAMAMPPRRPWPTFWTVAAGPLTNLLICALCATGVYLLTHVTVPHSLTSAQWLPNFSWRTPAFYLWYIYLVSAFLLFFNLLPIYPLDGGQMLQAVLWRFFGYGKALLAASFVGIAGAILLSVYALLNGQLLMLCIAISCMLYCIRQRAAVRAAGVWSFEDYDFQIPLRVHRHHHLSRFAKWKARRAIHQEETEQLKVDAILQKVHLSGMHSLTWGDKRILRKATERQRKSEMEVSRR